MVKNVASNGTTGSPPSATRTSSGSSGEMGLRFDFRQFRRAFGQNALDRGPRLDSVSVALGHHSTKTTEAYYARIRTKDAFRDLERVWVTPSVQKPAD